MESAANKKCKKYFNQGSMRNVGDRACNITVGLCKQPIHWSAGMRRQEIAKSPEHCCQNSAKQRRKTNNLPKEVTLASSFSENKIQGVDSGL